MLKLDENPIGEYIPKVGFPKTFMGCIFKHGLVTTLYVYFGHKGNIWERIFLSWGYRRGRKHDRRLWKLVQKFESQSGYDPERIAEYPHEMIIDALSKATTLSNDFFNFHPRQGRGFSLHPIIQQIIREASAEELFKIASGKMQLERDSYILLEEILHNPRTSREAKLYITLKSGDLAFQVYSSLRDTLTIPEIQFVSNSRNYLVLEDILSDPSTPEDILAKYVNGPTTINMRKVVVNNPYVVALIEEARTLTDLEGLVSLSRKPFPCVRTEVARNLYCPPYVLEELANDPKWLVKLTAAKNPNTSSLAVAKVLSEIRKDKYETQIGTETRYECVAACHDGERWEYVEYPVYDTRYGYVSKSLETAREILHAHTHNRVEILDYLRKLNPELSKAIVQSEPANCNNT